MRKIDIYVVVGSDAGKASGGLMGIKVVRVQAESTRKSARQNVNKPLVVMQRESLCSHWHSRRKTQE
jgi:hypothetical protein